MDNQEMQARIDRLEGDILELICDIEGETGISVIAIEVDSSDDDKSLQVFAS